MTFDAIDYEALKAAAESGDAAAQYALALRLFRGDRAPVAPGHGVRWVMEAAAKDYAPALQSAAVFVTMGLDGPADWQRAISYLSHAAALGDAQAQGQIALLGEAAKFDLVSLAAAPAATPVMDQPRIRVIKGFLAPDWCDWIIARAKLFLSDAVVYAAAGLVNSAGRTGTNAIMRPERSDIVLEVVNARISSATGVPVGQQETSHILHYEVGQEFKPHFDFINSHSNYGRRDINLYGQRIITVLICLNDEFEGGETHFLHPDWKWRGDKGDALLFWNLTPEGKGDATTRHAGLAPTRGEKWLLSKWIHDQPMPSF